MSSLAALHQSRSQRRLPLVAMSSASATPAHHPAWDYSDVDIEGHFAQAVRITMNPLSTSSPPPSDGNDGDGRAVALPELASAAVVPPFNGGMTSSSFPEAYHDGVFVTAAAMATQESKPMTTPPTPTHNHGFANAKSRPSNRNFNKPPTLLLLDGPPTISRLGDLLVPSTFFSPTLEEAASAKKSTNELDGLPAMSRLASVGLRTTLDIDFPQTGGPTTSIPALHQAEDAARYGASTLFDTQIWYPPTVAGLVACPGTKIHQCFHPRRRPPDLPLLEEDIGGHLSKNNNTNSIVITKVCLSPRRRPVKRRVSSVSNTFLVDDESQKNKKWGALLPVMPTPESLLMSPPARRYRCRPSRREQSLGSFVGLVSTELAYSTPPPPIRRPRRE